MPANRKYNKRRNFKPKRKYNKKRKYNRKVTQKQVETKVICCSGSDSCGAGPQLYQTSSESQRPITSPVLWPAPLQLGIFGTTRSSFEGGGSAFSSIVTADYLFEPVRSNAPTTIYPHGMSGRIEGRNCWRKWQDHKIKITFPSNCKWQVEAPAAAKANGAPPSYLYMSVNRATIQILHALVPVHFPTDIGDMDTNQSTETIKTQIKTILDNYYGASDKEIWRRPGRPCPFRVLKNTYHNRLSKAVGPHAQEPAGDPDEAGGTSQMMPINDNFKFTKNTKMWYISRDEDVDDGALSDLHNLATAKVQWCPVSYIRVLNRDGHNERSLNADNQPTSTAFAINRAPVVNHRCLVGLTDA